MVIIGFFKQWLSFIRDNAIRHMKRISVSVGAFLFLSIVSIPLGFEAWLIAIYAGVVETSGIILMSLFGKNGNGNSLESNLE